MGVLSGRARTAAVLHFAIALLAGAQPHPCQTCHPQEVERFNRSAMGNSIAAPANEPAGSFEHKQSGGRVHISWKGGRMTHEIQQSGLTATYPASYAIGFGNVGKSYLVEIGGRIFQSPAAFYTGRNSWSESPGYENDPILDFWRSIDSSCLSCHAGAVTWTADRTLLSPITCDRCHGDSTSHLRNPIPGSIVNPAKLALRQRDSVCEQCHLEGATTVLNPGRHWGEFKPGEQLDQLQTTYVLRSATGSNLLAAVSHAEQLALSACKRADPGKLWCGICHDAHAPAGDHRQQINMVCGSCHTPVTLTATHKPGSVNCVACHMPKLHAADISHAAITDHRILRKPAAAASLVPPGATELTPWTPPPAELTRRNLGLALFNLAREGKPAGSYPDSFSLLTSAAPIMATDGAAAAAEGYMLLGSGHPESAVSYFQKAVAADGQSPEYWLDLGVAQQAQGNFTAAEESLRHSIRCNPTDYRPYEVLAGLMTKTGRKAAASEVVHDFLQVNPQSILMRIRHGS